ETWIRQAETEIVSSGLGPTYNSEVAVAHAMLFERQGKIAEAVAALDRAWAEAERNGEGLNYAGMLDLEAGLLSQQGDLVRSIDVGSRALAAYEERVGPDHPQLALPLTN